MPIHDTRQMEQIALRAVYEQRACPPDEILFADRRTDELTAHLGFCRFCADRLAISSEERKAWEQLARRMRPDFPMLDKELEPAPGQVWSLDQKGLGGWEPTGRYITVPSVLLLAAQQNGSQFKVAQIGQEEVLAGTGDVALVTAGGFAESWNSYALHKKYLSRCLATVDHATVGEVLCLTDLPQPEPASSLVKRFREFELEVAKHVAIKAQLEHGMEAGVKKPGFMKFLQIYSGLFETVAGLFTPVRIAALATMIIAVISLAILNNNRDQLPQIAKALKPMSTEPGTPSVTPQPKTTILGAPSQTDKTLTLMASADVVMLSKEITSVESLEFTRSGNDSVDKGSVAFKVGVAFINLVAADKKGDKSAKPETAVQLEHLIPMINKKQTIKLPDSLGEKQVLETFTNEIEKAASRSDQLVNLQFGSWLQSLRVADDEQLLKSITPATVQHFKIELTKQKSASDVILTLNKLEGILGSKDIKATEIRNKLDELYDAF